MAIFKGVVDLFVTRVRRGEVLGWADLQRGRIKHKATLTGTTDGADLAVPSDICPFYNTWKRVEVKIVVSQTVLDTLKADSDQESNVPRFCISVAETRNTRRH